MHIMIIWLMSHQIEKMQPNHALIHTLHGMRLFCVSGIQLSYNQSLNNVLIFLFCFPSRRKIYRANDIQTMYTSYCQQARRYMYVMTILESSFLSAVVFHICAPKL